MALLSKVNTLFSTLILLILFAPSYAQTNMTGEVYDIVSQAPIESVLVVLQTNPPESTYTDNNGYFSFGPGFLSGDANGSGDVNGLDVIYLVAYLKGGPAIPPPIFRADANGSCSVNGLDVTYLVAYFKGGLGPIFCDTLILSDTARVVKEMPVDGNTVVFDGKNRQGEEIATQMLFARITGNTDRGVKKIKFVNDKQPVIFYDGENKTTSDGTKFFNWSIPVQEVSQTSNSNSNNDQRNNKVKIKDLEDVVLTENSIPMIIQAPGYVEYHTSLDTTQTLEYGVTPVEIGNDSLFNMTDYYDIFGSTHEGTGKPLGKYDFESMTGNFMLFLNDTGSQGLTEPEINMIVSTFYDNIEDMTRKADGGSYLTADNIDVVIGDMWEYQLPDDYLTLCFADRDMPFSGSNGYVANGDTIYANWASFNGVSRKTVNSEIWGGMFTEEQEKNSATLFTVFDEDDYLFDLTDADRICSYLQGFRRISTYFDRTISGPDTTYTEYDPEFVQPIAPRFSEPTVYSSNGKIPEILYDISERTTRK